MANIIQRIAGLLDPFDVPPVYLAYDADGEFIVIAEQPKREAWQDGRKRTRAVIAGENPRAVIEAATGLLKKTGGQITVTDAYELKHLKTIVGVLANEDDVTHVAWAGEQDGGEAVALVPVEEFERIATDIRQRGGR